MIKPVFILFLLISPLLAESEEYKLYKTAYAMEKKYSVLSLRAYERALHGTKDEKLKQTILGRLHALYDKHGKYPEMIALHKNYKTAFNKKLWPLSIKKIAKNINAKEEQVESIVEAVFTGNPELLLQVLKESPANKGLHLFVLSLLSHNGKYELLDVIYANATLAGYYPENKIIYLIKANRSAIREIHAQAKDDLKDGKKAMYLYLMGMYLRARSKYLMSGRFFYMSAAYSNKLNATNETAKSLIATGRYREACDLQLDQINESSESDVLLKIFCDGDLKKQKTFLQPVLRQIAANDTFRFYKHLEKAYD